MSEEEPSTLMIVCWLDKMALSMKKESIYEIPFMLIVYGLNDMLNLYLLWGLESTCILGKHSYFNLEGNLVALIFCVCQTVILPVNWKKKQRKKNSLFFSSRLFNTSWPPTTVFFLVLSSTLEFFRLFFHSQSYVPIKRICCLKD